MTSTTQPITENALPMLPETAVPTEARPTEETVLQEIGRDCRVRPQRYLDEIVVPFGGE
jgi:hypothetical protein